MKHGLRGKNNNIAKNALIGISRIQGNGDDLNSQRTTNKEAQLVGLT